MALLTDKTTKKKLENRLKEFTEYGMTIYYLLEEEKTNIKDLESIFFSQDDEKSSFIYGKIMKHIKPTDLKKAYDKYSINYQENDNEDENKFKKDLNIIYTEKIIDLILDKTNNLIDKTYINTYKYLLANLKTSR